MRRLAWAVLLIGMLAAGFATVNRPAPPAAAASGGEGAVCPTSYSEPRALLAGDSWAQLMWDDQSHNDIFDKFGHADKRLISRSLGADPGPGYTGPEYAISGSEARQWVDAANYPWIANMVADLAANATIDTVVLSIGGNDVLAGRSGGGWYHNMDLDQPGAEAALFARILTDTEMIVDAALAMRPEMSVMISSYDYPNFNVGWLWCWIYACPMRRDLSYSDTSPLVTDAELNGMMVSVEGQRIGWVNANGRRSFDHSVGLMHHYYGDGVSGPGELPHPGQTPPDYAPFPGGNPLLPSLRANFRLAADPIHLNYDGYQYKITSQTEAHFLPRFRGEPHDTFFSQGGPYDGWTDGQSVNTNGILVGDNGQGRNFGIVSFDTTGIPDGAPIRAASLYLLRDSLLGTNPFTSGALGLPVVDVVGGSFGAPELEPGDATAPADAFDAGCWHGTVRDRFYAIRIDLTAEALAAINDQGLTQFRLSFPGVNPATDGVLFMDGDSQLLIEADRITTRVVTATATLADGSTAVYTRTIQAISHQGLAEVMGSPAPFLDVTYASDPTAVRLADWGVVMGASRLALWLAGWLALVGMTAVFHRRRRG